MCREKEILAKAAEEIAQAEKNWRNNRASVFPASSEEWEEELERVCLKDFNVRICKHIQYLQETKYMAEAMGETWSFIKFFIDPLLKMVKYSLLSRKIQIPVQEAGKSKKSSSEKNQLQNMWVMCWLPEEKICKRTENCLTRQKKNVKAV